MIRWTVLAPWEFEFPFPGSLESNFLVAHLPRVWGQLGATEEAKRACWDAAVQCVLRALAELIPARWATRVPHVLGAISSFETALKIIA